MVQIPPFYFPSLSAAVDCGSLLNLDNAQVVNDFRCYEVKKAGSRQESNPGQLWLEPPVLCHQPREPITNPSQFSIYAVLLKLDNAQVEQS